MRILLPVLTLILCLPTTVQAAAPSTCWLAIQTMKDGKGFRECERLFEEEGDSEAALSLYSIGLLTKKIPFALDWLHKATEPSKQYPEGHPQALYEMGKAVLYRKYGLTLGHDIARNIFYTAAQLSFTPAYYEWTRMLEKGQGFKSSDLIEASKHYRAISDVTGDEVATARLAALCGDVTAAYELADYYSLEDRGEMFIPHTDREEAYLLFSIAAHLGHDEAAERASKLSKELSDDQVLAANEQLHRWSQAEFSKTTCGIPELQKIKANSNEADHLTDLQELEQRAEAGHPKAQYDLAVRYFTGNETRKDYAKAAHWAEKAAIENHSEAQALLGMLFTYGFGVSVDYKKGIVWLKKAVDKGVLIAQPLLAFYYQHGWGVPQDYAKSVQLMKVPAEKGNGVAQRELGKAYFLGQGVNQNFPEALNWLRKAARKGEDDAYGPLVAILNLGVEGTYGDAVEAEYWLEEFISSADWSSLNNTALWLANDPDDEFGWSGKNEALAFDLMLQAASKSPSQGPQGGAPETTLGWWYLTGKHQPAVPIDDEKAYYWNALGALDDHPNALVNLALMYATGIVVEQDYGQMVLLHLRALGVFARVHEQFLDDPDDWPEFHRATIPAHYMEAHKLYFEALRENKEEYTASLQALLVKEPPKSIEWEPCQLETGSYDKNGYWVSLDGQVSAFGPRSAAEDCLRQGRVPEPVFHRFLSWGDAADQNEAIKLKVAFTVDNSELIPGFKKAGRAYCHDISADSIHALAEREVCISRKLASAATFSTTKN